MLSRQGACAVGASWRRPALASPLLAMCRGAPAAAPRPMRALHLRMGMILPPAGRRDPWLRGTAAARDVSTAAGKGGKVGGDNPYRETVTLPQTAFSLRANSAVREPEIQRFWDEEGVYDDLAANNPGEAFTLHDGPPYANGDLHMGHAMNKILKDMINRYQLLKGRRARFVPGWDTHGLPIELKVLQSMPRERQLDLTPIKLRRKARDFALKTVEAQKAQFRRYGVWADWDEPYLTLQPAYEAAQLEVFGRMVAKGYIYRGRKPVHWSPSSQTALAEAELEYPEGHTSRSCYVALKIVDGNDAVCAERPASLAIWTTTPWTIPANRAVAVNPDLDYVLAAVGGSGDGWDCDLVVVAAELVEQLTEKLGVELTPIRTFKGRDLEGVKYQHPLFPERVQPVILGGDYITTDAGSGLVHTAPGHGQEDYQVAMKYGLEVFAPVDEKGVFTEAAGRFSGLAVLEEGNRAVLADLEGSGVLLKEEPYVHKYPYDWRTKKPVIFRATEQWFASVQGFKEGALSAIKSASWTPASGFNRINGMVEGRSDWCISRQRRWGVPIPAFYNTQTGEPLMTEETIAHVAKVVGEHGTDAWWQMPVEDLLPAGFKERASSLKKGQDTMDVWFDSGASWAGVLQGLPGLKYPADLYLEGSDQHRGWFQSSLLTSVAVNGKSPYGAVLTHGFLLDESGKKMSKSVGNVMDPRIVIEGGKNLKKQPAYGADVLRLWVAAVDYTNDVIFGPNILKQTAEVYRKIRGTVRFLLGSLADFDAQQHSVPYQSLPSLDRYMLNCLHAIQTDVDRAYATYQFSKVFQGIQRFVIVDLSNFYFDVAKDRLYVQGRSSSSRRACQTVMHHIFTGLLPSLAPILPHMAEDAWSCFQDPVAQHCRSVFKRGWCSPEEEWHKEWRPDEASAWECVFQLREAVTKALEIAREAKLIGAPLEAKVLIHMEDPAKIEQAASFGRHANGVDELRYIFITSSVDMVSEEAAAQAPHSLRVEVRHLGWVTVGVTRADGQKCSRCWNWSKEVGSDDKHPQLCERCLPVIEQMGFELPPKSSEESLVGASS